MPGRVVLTLAAVCLFTNLCSAQLFDPNRSTSPGHHGAFGDVQINNISGTVIGSDGSPLANVHVEIRNQQTGLTVASAYTNNGGSFEFDNVPSAQYEVVANQGIAEARERVNTSELAVNLRIRLNTRDAAAAHADGNATVSVAEYKVPQKARDAFHKAQEALVKNRRDDADKQLSKALDIYPQYAPALTLRGILSLDSEKVEAAVDDFAKAIQSDPGFAMAYTGMAAAMNVLQKFDDAIREADRAITLSPNSWQTYFEMAKSYLGKSDYKNALAQLTKAQQFEPKDFAPLHLVRAHTLIALQEYQAAMAELQEFLTLAPNDPNSGMARAALEKVKAFTAASAKPAIASAVK